MALALVEPIAQIPIRWREEPTKQVCIKCKLEKPIDRFYQYFMIRGSGPGQFKVNYRRNICHVCFNAQTKERRNKSKLKAKLRTRLPEARNAAIGRLYDENPGLFNAIIETNLKRFVEIVLEERMLIVEDMVRRSRQFGRVGHTDLEIIRAILIEEANKGNPRHILRARG